jgi:hypothetical protein
MRSQIVVVFDRGVQLSFPAGDAAFMSSDDARHWLDVQFTELDCEPLRASGKVLTADKVLRITEAAGPALFADEKWAAAYVSAVQASLSKPLIRVDVPAMAITY